MTTLCDSLLSRTRLELVNQRASLPWVFIAAVLLTLPNIVAAFRPHPDPLGLLMAFHALGLIMVPCLFGIRVRTWLTWMLPLSALVPISIVYLWFTDTLPTTFCILALSESDSAELGCFKGQGLVAGLTTIPFLLLAWWVIRRKISPDLRFGIVGRSFVLSGALAMLPFATYKVGIVRSARFSTSYTLGVFPVGTLYSVWEAKYFRDRIAQRRTIGDQLVVTQEKAEQKKDADDDREVNVLVIGESARGASFQINGYERPTSPCLSAMDGLISFKDVTAAAPMTLVAVPQMLTPAAPGKFVETLDLPSIPAVFRRAGYKVYWLSTQRKHGVYDTTTSTFSADADDARFLGGKLDTANRGNASTAQDWELLGPLCEILKKKEKKVLIVMHTMGSHGPAVMRYPQQLSSFPVDGSKYVEAILKTKLDDKDYEALLNAYDNSIHTTDWLLGQIVRFLKEQNTSSWMFYEADHGENVDGEGPFCHGTMTMDVLKIPLFVWTSGRYQADNPEKVEALKKHAPLPVSARSTFHTVLDMAGIECSWSKDDQSLASPTFVPGSRIVSNAAGGAADFDKEIKSDAEKRVSNRRLSTILKAPSTAAIDTKGGLGVRDALAGE